MQNFLHFENLYIYYDSKAIFLHSKLTLIVFSGNVHENYIGIRSYKYNKKLELILWRLFM